MKNFFLRSLLFIFFCSYSYSLVSYKIENQQSSTRTFVVYKPDIIITRTSENEAVDIKIQNVPLYIYKRFVYVHVKLKPNLSDLKSNKIDFNISKMYSNDGDFRIVRGTRGIITINKPTSNDGNRTNYLNADFQVKIPPNSPDFKDVLLGRISSDDKGENMGTITLITLKPLELSVPDIDFGDVLTTSGSQTRSGVITITGSKNTKVNYSHNSGIIYLYKDAKSKSRKSIKATWNITDGILNKTKITIPSTEIIHGKLEVKISNYEKLDPGKYQGDVEIEVNTN